MRKYLAAMIQMNTGRDREENLEYARARVEEAAQMGAKLICLPETMSFIGDAAETLEHAEDENGPSFRMISGLAKKYGVYVHGGSWAERIPGEPRVYNTSYLFSPAGTPLAKYRKMHLFDITMPDGGAARESEHVAPGREVVTAHTELGVLGFAICYDLRFPELFRLLALRGAQVILVPACFTLQTGKDHWEPLLRARAIENECYVIAPDQIGKNAGMTAFGGSMAVDPGGTVIARAGEAPGVTLAQIDLDYLDRVRSRMQTLSNRREDVYALRLNRGEAGKI